MQDSQIVILENGTSELRAGYKNKLLYKSQNKYYKTKDSISFNPSPGSVEKNMFDSDIITNFENMEILFDQAFKEIKLKDPEALIITEKVFTPDFSRKKILESVFELYNFKLFQFGNDAIYSANRNKIKGPTLLISLSNSMTSFIFLDDKIKRAFNLNFGARQCKKYIQEILTTRFFLKRIGDNLITEVLNNLKVADNYDEECGRILKEYKNKTFEDDYQPSFVYSHEEVIVEQKKPKRKPIVKVLLAEEEEEIVEEAITETTEEDDEFYEEESEKPSDYNLEKKPKKEISFFSGLYRFKQKILKDLNKLKENINKLEENYEIKTNLKGYLQRIKQRFNNLKETLKQRDNITRELKNKRSNYSIIKNKDPENINKEKEFLIYEKILWVENPENFIQLEKDFKDCIEIIKNHEPGFEPFEEPSYESLKGFTIERRRIPEILFEPSIINMHGLGIIEVLGQVSTNRIFLTGGFSQIKNLKERIYIEGLPFAINGKLTVLTAKDPIYDSFYGAEFLDCLPTFTKEEYLEYGAENLIKRIDF